MSGGIEVIAEGGTVTIRVPIRCRERWSRKVVISPVAIAGSSYRPVPGDGTHKTILKALGRAHRWKRMLESGEFSSITDLAASERINHSYVRRILRLTLLSPANVERILDGQLAKTVLLEDLLKTSPDDWSAQVF